MTDGLVARGECSDPACPLDCHARSRIATDNLVARRNICGWLRQWAEDDLVQCGVKGDNEKTIGYIAAAMIEGQAHRIEQLERELNDAVEWNAGGWVERANAAESRLALATAIIEREGNRNDELNCLKSRFDGEKTAS